MNPNCYMVGVDWYHQHLAEAARDRDLVTLYQLKTSMLESQIERQEKMIELYENQIKEQEKLVSLYEKLVDLYKKNEQNLLLSFINEN